MVHTDIAALVAAAAQRAGVQQVARVCGMSRTGIMSIIARRARRGTILGAEQHVEELRAIVTSPSTRPPRAA